MEDSIEGNSSVFSAIKTGTFGFFSKVSRADSDIILG